MSQETVIENFRTIVNEVVQAAPDTLGQPIYVGPKVVGERELSVDGLRLHYKMFQVGPAGSYRSYQGLPFVPTHSVELARRDAYGRAMRQTIFGANENRLMRSHIMRGALHFPAFFCRELEEPEAEALVDFLEKPYTRNERLEMALHMSTDEATNYEAWKADTQATADKLHEDLEEMNKVRQRGWQEARNVILH